MGWLQISLFNRDLRGLLQVAPNYMQPVLRDARTVTASDWSRT